MVKLHEMRFSLKFKDMTGCGWWYYLETGKSVIFIRVASDTNIHMKPSNKQRLWEALPTNPQHRTIEIADRELENLVDRFYVYPESPAIFGSELINPYERKIREKIEGILFNLYKKEYVKTHGLI